MNTTLTQILLLILLTTLSFLTIAADEDFYDQSQRGWFWHETAPVIEEPEEIEDAPPPATEQQKSPEEQMVNIDVEWLKKNLPNLQAKAISNPTTENLGAFYAAQRLMLDYSSQFANKSSEFFRKEASWLSEDHRRPTDSFMLNRFKSDVLKAQRPVIEKVASQAGIWFFFSSTCPYCLKQLPLVQFLSREYGMNVLYVSLDGGSIPGIPDDKVVIDYNGQASKEFNVTVTPTTFLVSNDASKFELLSNGVSALPKIQDALVTAAHKYDWISDNEYKSVQSVRRSNVLENGLLQIKESELSNPEFLYQALQRRVDLTTSPVGTPIRNGVNK
ncbi:conjugal transfer protein TraF [Shewanella algicola]|uniref:conjugal transfer protein TraF n=1 Tax=Shewanella algicola TaxID=640633 RepID=UPI0024949072|nr:conjugal transfer protein TraF [Shewanella algicola]